MIPDVILHSAVSLDGRVTNFPADLDLYYTLAARWNPDAILFGSETVLAALRQDPGLEVPPEHEEMFSPPDGGPDPRPLLVIADSRGRVRCWDALRKWPYFRDALAFCSEKTPQEYRNYLGAQNLGIIVAGDDRIDMRAAMEMLNLQYGVRTIRVDSGGTLNSVCLKAGVVSEVSVLIHPFLAGGTPEPTLFDPQKAGFGNFSVPLVHRSTEVMREGIVWTRYSVKDTTAP
jgi:2,5-diamino-6-(ribosylamino)-4(3H)-pyrimidinone 5'-phosphate reductase